MIVIVRLNLRTGLCFDVRQAREMSVDHGSIMIITLVQVEHRAIDHRKQQLHEGGTRGEAAHQLCTNVV